VSDERLDDPDALFTEEAGRFATADAVATLHRLNAQRIIAWAQGDLAWYRAHLAEDFASVLEDGRRADRARYLELAAEASGANHASAEEVDVHPLGEVAVLRGVARFWYGDSSVSLRYTDVWVKRRNTWLIVSAHSTSLALSRRVERASGRHRRGVRRPVAEPRARKGF
jgi:ketosteroid isomerase-like protein